MSEFIIPEIVETSTKLVAAHYDMPRADQLQRALATIFSRHLGKLRTGAGFEAEWLMVTGSSGSGKTTELEQLVRKFNASNAMLPSGNSARIVSCMLDGLTGWKSLGVRVLDALGYHISSSSRRTQAELWRKVRWQAREQGVVGIHFDEAQHVLRGKGETERAAILDSFKTLLKSRDWPLMLILSGVPELEGYLEHHDQLLGKRTRVEFSDIALPDDYTAIHELVGSYALHFGLSPSAALLCEDFYARLTVASAHRWGLLINIVAAALTRALETGSDEVDVDHFVDAWVERTLTAPSMTPFLHPHYRSIYSADRPFWVKDQALIT